MSIIYIIDPGNGEAEDHGQDPAAAAAAGAEGGDDRPVDERALAAFDEGVAEAEDGPGDPPIHEHKGEGDEDGQGAAGDGSGESDGKPPAAPGDGGEETPEQKAEREQAERAAAAKAEDDKAVKELNLRGKAEQRFRDLSGQVRSLNEQLEKLGGQEVVETIGKIGGREGLARVLRDAEDQRVWDENLTKIGATAEQFGQAVGYIAAFNSQDPAVWKQARENLLREVAVLDQRLGDKTDRYDPLEAHDDLKQRVRKGELDEADAVEIARLRAAQAQTQQQSQAQAQAQQEQARQQQERDAGLQALHQLGAELKASDPVNFQRKMAAIKGAIEAALPNVPPSQWAAHARALYQGVQLPAPPPAPPRVGKQPVRQGAATIGAAGGGSVHRNQPIDPLAAFDQGVEEARETGL